MLHITFSKYDRPIRLSFVCFRHISSIGILSLYIHYFEVITKSYNYMTSCISVLKYVSYFTYRIFKICLYNCA